MRNQSVNDIKKRIAQRRKKFEREAPFTAWNLVDHQADFNDEYNFRNNEKREGIHTELVILRLLASICLVLVLAVIFKLPHTSLQPIKTAVGQALKSDFEFAAASDWLVRHTGNLFSFLPDGSLNQKTSDTSAIPVDGRILESFKKNGQGITVETAESNIESIAAGVVVFAGKDPVHGNTVVVQQANKTKHWYGQLESVEVNLYQHIKKGEKLGNVISSTVAGKGEYYFAIEEDGKFIDPASVITFE